VNGQRAAAEAALDRGLVAEVPDNFWSAVDIARAFAFRGVAFWILGRTAQARKSFEFDASGLPPRERILIAACKTVTAGPYPLPHAAAIAPACRALEDAGLGAYASLLRMLTERDANDVELSPAEIETLREFDRYGGRAADVAKALGKSKFTVQNQIQSAIRKLGCSGRAEALAYARKRGWLDPTPS
jgi:DNA-binding CsgD family transcriptional regulator